MTKYGFTQPVCERCWFDEIDDNVLEWSDTEPRYPVKMKQPHRALDTIWRAATAKWLSSARPNGTAGMVYVRVRPV